MWICQTIFKFETHGFVHEIPMLENTYYLWQPYQKYSTSTKIVYVHLIREMKVTHDSFILLCFIANINKFAALTQFNFFFWYTMKPRKINSWTYIFQILFLVAFCWGPRGLSIYQIWNINGRLKIASIFQTTHYTTTCTVLTQFLNN